MHARTLMQVIGDEEAIFKEDVRKLEAIPRISRRLIGEIRNPEVLKKAEKELEFVQIISSGSFSLPMKITPTPYQCIDAPLLLYAKATPISIIRKTISVIGTRNPPDMERISAKSSWKNYRAESLKHRLSVACIWYRYLRSPGRVEAQSFHCSRIGTRIRSYLSTDTQADSRTKCYQTGLFSPNFQWHQSGQTQFREAQPYRRRYGRCGSSD
jgi:hypothetical protein